MALAKHNSISSIKRLRSMVDHDEHESLNCISSALADCCKRMASSASVYWHALTQRENLAMYMSLVACELPLLV